ncbi:MAG: hypothetical protein ACM3JH_08065 [Acidithiobacillales bacterium]
MSEVTGLSVRSPSQSEEAGPDAVKRRRETGRVEGLLPDDVPAIERSLQLLPSDATRQRAAICRAAAGCVAAFSQGAKPIE